MPFAPIMVGPSPNDLAAIPAPTDMSWADSDVSSSAAGRTNDADARMHKDRVTTKKKLSLTWKNINGVRAAVVLQAFSPEYFWVQYHDPARNEFVVKEFYAGDRQASPHQYFVSNDYTIGGVSYKTLSLNIIER